MLSGLNTAPHHTQPSMKSVKEEQFKYLIEKSEVFWGDVIAIGLHNLVSSLSLAYKSKKLSTPNLISAH